MNEIKAICVKDSKIVKVEVDGILLDINDVINNINKGIVYTVKNGTKVSTYDKNHLRSNPDLSKDNNLLSLPKSNKCNG